MYPDYDKSKFHVDSYGHLYPKKKTRNRTFGFAPKKDVCDGCRMKETCPAKREKCNNYERITDE